MVDDGATKLDTDDLQEGSLYVYKKGTLQEIETDPDDMMKKIRITEEAYQSATVCQRSLRKMLSGYRPDISVVCSALIYHTAQRHDAKNIVRDYVLRVFQHCNIDTQGSDCSSTDQSNEKVAAHGGDDE